VIPLVLGPDVIERLIPHRRPLAMVDGIVAYAHKPSPILHAHRHISANEPVFDGHFPGLHLWPGVYTIEGLGQTMNLVFAIEGIVREYEARGSSLESVLDDLRNLESGYRLAPGYKAARAKAFLEALALGPPGARGGMSAAVDVKLLRPVFAGQRIDYEVVVTHAIDSLARAEVVALVDAKVVAKGVMKSTLGMSMPEAPP
jgi:3-hydroxyacyl-[acyl-carrier-protein] dehydratase